MNLAEKREKLAGLRSAITEKQTTVSKLEKDLNGVKVKVKEATSEELIDQLEADRKTINDALDAAKADLQSTQDDANQTESDIDDEEKALEEISKKGISSMADNKNKAVNGATAYLKTKQAVTDFAEVLKSHMGADSEDVKKAWESHLKTKGVTNPEALLPEAVVSSITDAFDKSVLWGLLKKSGLTVLKRGVNINNGLSSRARGHKRGTDKKEQDITVVTKEVRAQYVYKYITLDKETLRENDTNAIINYVMSELPVQIVNEIERAIVIGDGREAGDDDKISKLEAIVDAGTADVAPDGGSNPTGSFKAVSHLTGTTADNVLDLLVDADEAIKAEGDRVIFAKRSFVSKLKKLKDTNGAFMFPFGADLAAALGVKGLFTPTWMEASDYDFVEFALPAYELVGDNTIESLDNFILQKNKYEYLQEIYVGGALTAREAAVTLKISPSSGQ